MIKKKHASIIKGRATIALLMFFLQSFHNCRHRLMNMSSSLERCSKAGSSRSLGYMLRP